MNKLGKSKIIGIAAASLAAVAVASVGFSSWVVSTLKNIDIQDFAVEVAAIQDKSIKLDHATVTYPKGKAEKINFDADPQDSTGLLKAGEGSDPQLSFGIQLEITLGPDSAFNGISAWMEITSGDESKVADSKSDGEGKYFVSPIALGTKGQSGWTKPANLTPIWTAEQLGNVTKDGATANTITSDQKEFQWGKFFNSQNPSKLTDESEVPSYVKALSDMKGYKFKIHLELVA